jgi:DNA-binding CsgD family transcriptional regulator
MTFAVSTDHPTIQLKPKIQEICVDFLNQFGFSYFQYLRCYADGSVTLLTNNTSLTEYFAEIDNQPVVFSSYTEEHENLHSYWFLWDEELPTYPVSLAKNKFNIHNGLTLVRRSKTYYDMIAVALPEHCNNAGSFYLNKMKAIEQFITSFDRNNKDLINLINANPLVLPTNYRDINYQKLCLTNNRVKINGANGPSYLTSQELACLRLLLQGNSYKQIGVILEISDRTVESYILRIKHRTGFKYHNQLESLISICP